MNSLIHLWYQHVTIVCGGCCLGFRLGEVVDAIIVVMVSVTGAILFLLYSVKQIVREWKSLRKLLGW